VPSLHAPFSSSQTPSSNSLHRSPSLSKHSISHDQLARSSSHKRPRASPGPSTSAPSSSSLVLPLPRLPHPPIQPGSPPLPYISHPPKATLLSPSQKKANHIQSEQKRRANIRRGYEALCETVPALREAIKEEEAMALAANDDSRSGGVAMKGRGKRGRGRGKLEDGEKIDGRAGPRSENVVLSKSECLFAHSEET
jgi:hypothetical protein